jgi:hypothetical protein
MTRTADQPSGNGTANSRVALWHFPQSEPVIRPGQLHPEFDSGRASAAHVVRMGDKHRLVYWGGNPAGNYILQAVAPVDSPNDWKPLGGPLIGPQPESDYNFQGPSFPFLLPVTDTYWPLYFCAWGNGKDGKLPNTTGVAISEDAGKTWRNHDRNPILAPGAFNSHQRSCPCMVREGAELRCWYTGNNFGTTDMGYSTANGE